MKNFVFISPHFPETYYRFCKALKERGFCVLGIGDEYYDNLTNEMKESLDEYYQCFNMDDFYNEIKAVNYFQNKYGHIDYIESNNEYWLSRDAKLREIFNVSTGIRGKDIEFYQHKSKMKELFIKAKANVAKYCLVTTKEDLIKFVNEVNYPVFIKPDVGMGAEGSFHIRNNKDLDDFFLNKDPNVTYICEQYVTGNIVTYDGISDSKGNVIFETSEVFPPSISEIVKEKKDLFYYCLPSVPSDLAKVGRKIIKTFKVKNRFFHIEFFRLTKDISGLAKKDELVALEVNMRPPGGYTPDIINFANSVDCYQIWADSIAFNENRFFMSYPKYYGAVASRRDEVTYFYRDEEIKQTFKNNLCAVGRYPFVLSNDMGNRFFMGKFDSLEELEVFRDFVERRAGEPLKLIKTSKRNKPRGPICDTHIDGA